MIIILKTIMLLMAASFLIKSTIKASNKNYNEANYNLLWAIFMMLDAYIL